MSIVHQFTSSNWVQSGSQAQFKSGVNVNGSLNGVFIGNGTNLTNISSRNISASLFFGSESLNDPPTYGDWITGSGGEHTITLSTSASHAAFNHFTFLRQNTHGRNDWEERSDYTGTFNGLRSQDSLTETLDTGIYRYLLLAMSTASKQTLIQSRIVIINPDE